MIFLQTWCTIVINTEDTDDLSGSGRRPAAVSLVASDICGRKFILGPVVGLRLLAMAHCKKSNNNISNRLWKHIISRACFLWSQWIVETFVVIPAIFATISK